MNRKTLFASAVSQSIKAFNDLPEETRIGLENATKIRSLFATIDVNPRPERMSLFASELENIFSFPLGPLVVGEIKRDVQPFLIAKATANPNGHRYSSKWFFVRGSTIRTPYLLDPDSSECGESLNQVCEPEAWVTPSSYELAEVIDAAWFCYKSKPDSAFATWVNTYFAPLSFLITEEENEEVSE